MTSLETDGTTDDRGSDTRPTVRLRVLETTDLHGNLRAYNYYADQPVTTYGLTKLSPLISEARAECVNNLLFDDGDFLQGTPLSDLTVQPANGWQGVHPVMSAMNSLGYDAAGLGNHEFNFGLPRLVDVLSHADFPITCGNAFTTAPDGPSGGNTLLPPYLILDRKFADTAGIMHDLKIGILGLVPPQVGIWDQFHLSGRLWLKGMLETAQVLVPQMRAAGADIVIVLAHTGIESGAAHPMMENAALPLVKFCDVDVLLAGHTHQLFPSDAYSDLEGADTKAGTLHGTPTVMAGFRGSHLGVVDLELVLNEGAWSIASGFSHLRAVDPNQREDETLKRQIEPAHAATIALTRQPVGHSAIPLHSYLVNVGQSSSVQIVTRAQRAAIMEIMGSSLDPDIPLLSASAPFKAGGRGGSKHYSDVPAGPLFLRHATDLYPFPNVLCLLSINGTQLRDWLERAATIFNTIPPGSQDQLLLNPKVPSHTFDIIDGLSYRIDLTQPARYDDRGQALDKGGTGRIRQLCHAGEPVQDCDQFVIATNNYRAFGGGPYEAANKEQILFAGSVPIVDIVADFIRNTSPLEKPLHPIWRFEPSPNTHARFFTGPGLRAYPDDITSLGLTDLGNAPNGFAQFLLPF